MLEVAESCAELVAEEILPLCMVTLAKAPILNFTVGCDVDVYKRWDEKLYFTELTAMGFSEKGAANVCKRDKDNEIAIL